MNDDKMYMAWNEPGKGPDKDPWGKNNGNNEGPPDLDKIIKDLNQKIRKIFKGSSGGNGGGSGFGNNGNFSFKGFGLGFGAIIFIFAILYIAAGFYVVKPAEQAVITRFGKYQRTVGQGPHWMLPIIESKVIVNTERVEFSLHKGTMLTKDENIVDVAVEVQYRIDDLENYLFNVYEPNKSLSQAADSALRQVIGNSTLENIIAKGKEQISDEIDALLRKIVERYDLGIYVVAVTFKEANPPAAVKEAFDDVIQAREERERLKYQAESYANKILPEARGMAKRIVEEAEAYRESVILAATGDASKFNAVLAEYKYAPFVTKKRLYLDTIESVFANSSKILVDINAGNNLIYLPIDKIVGSNNVSKNNSSDEKKSDLEHLVEKTREEVSKSEMLREKYEAMRKRRG